jgi:tetratricopeptide (TPR) repeat protein
MANKTRKRLTKTQLKKDPVADNLMKGWAFFNQHLKEIIIAFIIIIVAIFIIQSAVSGSKKSRRQSLAVHMLADTYLSQALSATSSGQQQQIQMAMSGLQQARQVAMLNYRNNPGTDWGKRSGILAAKCAIIMGSAAEAIDLLNELLATGPEGHLRAEMLIHLATAQENRGGQQDLEGAVSNCREILEIVPDSSAMAMEAMAMLGRIAASRGELEEARDYIASRAAIRGDTTEYEMYQLRRIDLMEKDLI